MRYCIHANAALADWQGVTRRDGTKRLEMRVAYLRQRRRCETLWNVGALGLIFSMKHIIHVDVGAARGSVTCYTGTPVDGHRADHVRAAVIYTIGVGSTVPN